MWRRRGTAAGEPVTTGGAPRLQLAGVVPASKGSLYEFSVPGEGMVHLHDGCCIRIDYEPGRACLTLVFDFEQEWAPRQRPGGCLVRLAFDQVSITAWYHAARDMTPEDVLYGGQCSGFDRCGETTFRLELLSDVVIFSAAGLTAEVLDRPTAQQAG